MTLPDPPILVITDRRRCRQTLEDRAAALFRGGCRWLSLRENDMDPALRRDLLARLKTIASPFGATVMVHRDLDAAVACRVGLHLPAGASSAEARRRLGAGILIGQSCHNEAEIAAADEVDYATVSPVFESRGKPGYGPALGRAGLMRLNAADLKPLLALGGVTPATLADLKGTGIAGVAIMGEAMSTSEPEAWFDAIKARWDSIASG